jgi:hypothetical protein
MGEGKAISAPHALAAAASPWTGRQRLVLIVPLVVGVIGLIAGYAGTSETIRLSHQVVWVNVAGAALLVSGAGIILFLTAGRRAIGQRRLGLFGNVAESKASTDPSSATSAGDLVAAPTMTKYHRADCSFVAGKPGVVVASAAGHEQAGRRPCGVCLPGGES